MKRLEALSIAAALGLGSVAGFASARWGWAPDLQKEGAASSRASLALAGAEARPSLEDTSTRAEGEKLEAILLDPLRSRRLVALDRFCDGLDAEGVRDAVHSLPAGEDTKLWEVRARLMSRWAELEPEKAAAFALESRNGNLGGVLEVWVARDAEAAKRFVAGIKDGEVLQETLYLFVGTLAERDFEDALRFAQSLPDDRYHNSIRGAFYRAAQKNPAATVARAMAMPAGDARASAIDATTDVWLGVNPQAAMAWVMQRPDMPLAHGQSLLQSAIQSWSRSDSAAAGRFVQNLPAGKPREDGIHAVASYWAWKDREHALQWVQSLPQDRAKAEALSSVISRWTYDDPPAAAAFLARQPADAKTGEMLKTIGARWAQVDPAGALAWAAQQQNETLIKSVGAEALGRLAADDPAGALAGLGTLPGGETRVAAIAAIAKNWADREPQAAARWVLELPEADASREALTEVIAQGTSRDPVPMAEWMETLKAHPQRDVAVEAFARAAQYHDPTAAADWANTLSDAAKRQPLVQKIVRDYANYDAPAARAWVLGQNFEAGERAALLGQIEKAEQRK